MNTDGDGDNKEVIEKRVGGSNRELLRKYILITYSSLVNKFVYSLTVRRVSKYSGVIFPRFCSLHYGISKFVKKCTLNGFSFVRARTEVVAEAEKGVCKSPTANMSTVHSVAKECRYRKRATRK